GGDAGGSGGGAAAGGAAAGGDAGGDAGGGSGAPGGTAGEGAGTSVEGNPGNQGAKLLDLIEQESLLANKEIQDYLSNLIKHSYESIDNGLIEEITADSFNLALELEQRNFIFEIEDFFA
ncbi:MAG: hypothetical protein EBQ70_01490, partial [Betaproteobacteria bacterium]|nr:hypothetical protein [Betaproteobacteria bacterium]